MPASYFGPIRHRNVSLAPLSLQSSEYEIEKGSNSVSSVLLRHGQSEPIDVGSPLLQVHDIEKPHNPKNDEQSRFQMASYYPP